MVGRDLERLRDPLLDRHARHDDHELREPKPLVELEDRPEIDVRLPRPRLHLDGEVHRVERLARRQAVFELRLPQIGVELVGEEHEPVADPKIVFGKPHPPLGVGGRPEDGELRPADLLAGKQPTDRLDGRLLVGHRLVRPGIGKNQLHEQPTEIAWRILSFSSSSSSRPQRMACIHSPRRSFWMLPAATW